MPRELSTKNKPPRVPRTATHNPHGMGRLEETAYNGPTLPAVPGYKIQAVADWLATHRDVHRPLNVAAPLLALVCALYDNQEYMPTRRRLAAWLRDNGHAEWNSPTPNSVDKAIQAAIALDEIELRYAIEPGNSKEMGDRGIIRRRYLVPSKQLSDAYTEAGRGFSTPSQPSTKDRGRVKIGGARLSFG